MKHWQHLTKKISTGDITSLCTAKYRCAWCNCVLCWCPEWFQLVGYHYWSIWWRCAESILVACQWCLWPYAVRCFSLHILLILDYAVKSTREPVLDCLGVLRIGSNNSNLEALAAPLGPIGWAKNKSSSPLGRACSLGWKDICWWITVCFWRTLMVVRHY